MKILLSSAYSSLNTYLRSIVDRIDGVTIVTEPQNFWTSTIQFDIVHIQWPEELFDWKVLNEGDLVNLKERLNFWKQQRAKIVATLHNAKPHKDNGFGEELYNLVYTQADCIVHLGNYSLSLYPNKNNVVIPHPNYNSTVKNYNYQKSNKTRFISLGAIRYEEEEELLIDAFKKAAIPNSELKIYRSLIGKKPRFSRREYLQEKIFNRKIKSFQKQSIYFFPQKLEISELDSVFSETDIVVIPRINSLNSGVVFMGFTYGKLVIGPNIGNIQEYLKINGNPIYEAGNFDSLAKAMRQSIGLKEIGKKNKTYSDLYFEARKIADLHVQMYKSLK